MREAWIYVSNSYVLLRSIIISESKTFFTEEMRFAWVSNLVDHYVVATSSCHAESPDCLSLVSAGDGHTHMVVKDPNRFLGCPFWSSSEIPQRRCCGILDDIPTICSPEHVFPCARQGHSATTTATMNQSGFRFSNFSNAKRKFETGSSASETHIQYPVDVLKVVHVLVHVEIRRRGFEMRSSILGCCVVKFSDSRRFFVLAERRRVIVHEARHYLCSHFVGDFGQSTRNTIHHAPSTGCSSKHFVRLIGTHNPVTLHSILPRVCDPGVDLHNLRPVHESSSHETKVSESIKD